MGIEMTTAEIHWTTAEGQKQSELIEVERFTDIRSAIEFFARKDHNGTMVSDGKEEVIHLINTRHRLNEKAKVRAALRPLSIERLGQLIRERPELLAKVNALLADLKLPRLRVTT